MNNRISAVPADPKSTRCLKDAGEGSCTDAGAAIASAVADALGRSALVDIIPLTRRRLDDLLALSSDPP